MSDLMLLGILRAPPPESNDVLGIAQLVSAAKSAANRIEADSDALGQVTAQRDAYETQAIAESRIVHKCNLRIDHLEAALDKLARLGNEPHYGNSDGNCIAKNALASAGESDRMTEEYLEAEAEHMRGRETVEDTNQ